MSKRILEVCVDSVESALVAERGGADRLELCSNLVIGGTTPSPTLFQEIRKYSRIPMRVLIRPRFGDFCYSEYEFAMIKAEIQQFRKLGAEAVVIGVLTPDGAVDVPRMHVLMQEAGAMEVTFHRAFDVCKEPLQAFDEIKKLGITTILTSGQKNSYVEGKELLRELVERAGREVQIMPGGGVTPENLKEMAPYIGAHAYHMSGKRIENSRMQYRKEGVSMGLPSMSEYEIWQTDEEKVRAAREVLDSYDKE